ncbi:MAG: hypothetical protein ABSH53_22190 [Holophaga sp.]
MPTIEETIQAIVDASTWDQRIAQIRLIPQRHGTEDQPGIHAAIARLLYVPHLAPDYAYVHEKEEYSREYFEANYREAESLSKGFHLVTEEDLVRIIMESPRTLLTFRTILGLTRNEFAYSTSLSGEPAGLTPISPAKVVAMEKGEGAVSPDQAEVTAKTITQIMSGSLFGEPGRGLFSKQSKPDTEFGWATVQQFAADKVPFSLFLHQRHYGGAFRQLLDATSGMRGNLIEDAVEALFKAHGIPYIRTGSHNQQEIAERFEVRVTPAPDFVVFDKADHLRGLLECKGANDGGTARDKALRFGTLKNESVRLGGIPLVAVLGGIGWARVNDTLGPVVRDTDGRVFTLSTLEAMLTVSPFASLVGLVSPKSPAL